MTGRAAENGSLALPVRPLRPARERAAIVAVFLVLGLCIGAWAAALPGIKLDLALEDRQISLALLGFAAGSILSTVVLGAVASRLGTRRATRIGTVAMAATLLLPAFAASLAQLVAAATAMGVAMGLLDVSMNGHAGALEERWGSSLMSSFHGAFSLGGLLGAALGGALAGAGLDASGQLTIASAVAGIIACAALPSLGPGAPTSEAGGVGLALPSRRLVGLGVVTAFSFVIEGAIGDWSAIYLDTVAGSGLAAAASGYAAFSVTMAGVRFAGDRAVEVLGARRIVIGGSAVAGAGILIAILVPVPFAASVGFALVGLGLGNVAPVAFGAAGRIGPTPATGIAPVATVGYAGLLLGPPVMGGLSSLVGLRWALGSLVLAAAVVALVGAQTVGRRSRT